ncbi:endonuclease/exonuclease/phosphatase family protein [Dactylosporangium fulvum]|uniref:Endonuclease/exonuclease/phosphatase family protein n=1 Tax=Dactylosporangium fulvum TaxID=53359 RepID=A0ABY5VLK8_9ACTN|nr:endonuclease/exonuclease/phosphatase family protein [Dactylosporangium fulvum]UWP78422.1 endonuclease/exonuclease/phosphatase family protein [Dactylosporangium fulvum]
MTETAGRSRWSGWSRRRGRWLAVIATLVAFVLLFHRLVPNAVVRLGSLLEAFLPWLGLAVPALLAAALLRRSLPGLVALVLPVAAWTVQFGGLLLPAAGGPADLVAVQHNASDENTDPAGTARDLMAAGPDLIALEEVTPEALPAYVSALGARYPHHTVHGTVGLWSRHPLTGARAVDIKPRGIPDGWSRGLRATAHTPLGDVAVYVAHLPSVRIRATGFDTAWRDESARLLGAAVAAEPLDRLILLGDLNSTVDDRGLGPVSSQLTWAPAGFALSWPAALPLARIDQVMVRSATVTEIRSLPATGSDHLPVAARVRF